MVCFWPDSWGDLQQIWQVLCLPREWRGGPFGQQGVPNYRLVIEPIRNDFLLLLFLRAYVCVQSLIPFQGLVFFWFVLIGWFVSCLFVIFRFVLVGFLVYQWFAFFCFIGWLVCQWFVFFWFVLVGFLVYQWFAFFCFIGWLVCQWFVFFWFVLVGWFAFESGLCSSAGLFSLVGGLSVVRVLVWVLAGWLVCQLDRTF